jgi:signal peptidase I
VVGSALVLSLILKTFFFQSFWIPSSSMENTLQIKDRILVTKWRPDPLEQRRGDIVVFKDPGGWLDGTPDPKPTGLKAVWAEVLTFTGLMPEDAGEHLVKRVIGLPGDTVACDPATDVVTVNGQPLPEDYLKPTTTSCTFEWSVDVPEGRLWVMGDNRSNSADSRAHMGDPGGGTIPAENVVGTAFVLVWPLPHWSGIGNPYPDFDPPRS